MKIFMLFEGPDKNDDAMVTAFHKLERALNAFNASRYAHAVLNEYEGTRNDPMETYVNTLKEKGA